MSEKYQPKVGDRVRVVLEGEVNRASAGFGINTNWIVPTDPHVVSVKKVEPAESWCLKDGGESWWAYDERHDGWRLARNVGADQPGFARVYSGTEGWTGPIAEHGIDPGKPPVEVFGPGTVVRFKGSTATFTVGAGGYLYHRTGQWADFSGRFTSQSWERVDLP